MAKPTSTPKRKDPSLKTLQRKTRKLLKKSSKEFKKRFPNLDKIKELLEQATELLTKSTEAQKKDRPKQRKLRKKERRPNLKLSYSLSKNYERHVAKFQTTSCSYKAKVSLEDKENVRIKDAMNTLENLFSNLIEDISSKCNLNTKKDKMRILVTSDKFKNPLSTRLVTLEEQKPSLILSEISRVLQSDEEIPLDSSFGIEVVSVKFPSD